MNCHEEKEEEEMIHHKSVYNTIDEEDEMIENGEETSGSVEGGLEDKTNVDVVDVKSQRTIRTKRGKKRVFRTSFVPKRAKSREQKKLCRRRRRRPSSPPRTLDCVSDGSASLLSKVLRGSGESVAKVRCGKTDMCDAGTARGPLHLSSHLQVGS